MWKHMILNENIKEWEKSPLFVRKVYQQLCVLHRDLNKQMFIKKFQHIYKIYTVEQWKLF